MVENFFFTNKEKKRPSFRRILRIQWAEPSTNIEFSRTGHAQKPSKQSKAATEIWLGEINTHKAHRKEYNQMQAACETT